MSSYDYEDENVQQEEEVEQVDAPTSPAIVIDAGSGMVKAGFAGEEIPRACFANVVGLPRCTDEKSVFERKEMLKRGSQSGLTYTIGEDALKNRGNLTLHYPMSRGLVEKWEQMEYVYEHLFFDKLDIVPDESKVLITQSLYTTKKNTQETVELLFELFGIQGICLMNQSLLGLYSTGRTTGLVIDSGDEITSMVSFFDEIPITQACNKMSLGGRDVVWYLQRLMLKSGYNFSLSSELMLLKEMKEDLCIISQDYEQDCKAKEAEFEKSFKLPDGQTIQFGKERFMSTEMLFNPMIIGKEDAGMAELAMKTFHDCPIDVRDALYKSIIIIGGNTMFSGFKERLEHDMNKHQHNFKQFKVFADPLRQFSSWQGGSVFASLSTFEERLTTIDEYNDYGANAIYRKK